MSNFLYGFVPYIFCEVQFSCSIHFISPFSQHINYYNYCTLREIYFHNKDNVNYIINLS